MGRTGVFIALDHLIQHVRDHDFVDIYGLVAELRSERMCMVQNLVSLHQVKLDFIPVVTFHKEMLQLFKMKVLEWTSQSLDLMGLLEISGVIREGCVQEMPSQSDRFGVFSP